MGTIARRGIAKPTLAAAATALAAFGLLWAGPAKAGTPVQIGQLSPVDPQCGPGTFNIVQASVAGPPSYTVPSAGTITSWSHRGRGTAPGTGRLQVWRAAGGTNYTLVGRSVLRAFVAGAVNTFATDIPVTAGDLLGLRSNDAGCGWVSGLPMGDAARLDGSVASDPAPGEARNLPTEEDPARVNVSATLDPTDAPPPADGLPSNEFSFKVKKNKKRGKATAKVRVPGLGKLVLAKNKKVKGKQKTAEEAGTVKMPIKPRRKAKRKLNERGKAKVNVEITYTPDGGEPNTKSRQTRLKKKAKKIICHKGSCHPAP